MAHAYSNAGFILYPTQYVEVGCLSVMKAMAMGCIPITSRLQGSVLFNLTRDFDFGPVPLSIHTNFTEWMYLFTSKVIDTKEWKQEKLQNLRSAMKYFTRSKYSWSNTAKIVIDVINMHSSNNFNLQMIT
jgi:glycosyltransferase involved in cell wall biosynthesis